MRHRKGIRDKQYFEAGVEATVEAIRKVRQELWEEHMKDPVAATHQVETGAAPDSSSRLSQAAGSPGCFSSQADVWVLVLGALG